MYTESVTARKVFEKYGVFITPEEKQTLKIQRDSEVSLDDITDLFELQGVSGEKALIKRLVCSSVNKNHFGLEGPSGSGKTFIIEKLISLLPEVYTLNQTSNLGTFYDSERINDSSFIYIPELQKSITGKNNPLIEIIKDITEGRSSTRISTNPNRDGIMRHEIIPTATLIYTLATENDYKPDNELSRRFMRFFTDNTEAHIKDILYSNAHNRMKLPQDRIEEQHLKSKIRRHLSDCLEGGFEVIDPFAKEIYSQFPSTVESITKANHYSCLVDGYVKFSHNNHLSIKLGDKTYLVTDLKDHQEVSSLTENDINIEDRFLDNARYSMKSAYPEIYDEWLKKQIL